MASVRFADVQARLTEFLGFTSLTLEEFQTLLPPFEAAFQAHRAAWRLDGKPRTARQSLTFSQFVARKKWLKSRDSPPCSSCQSHENRGTSSRPTQDHLYQLQPTTTARK
jgi:hypothetical protein